MAGFDRKNHWENIYPNSRDAQSRCHQNEVKEHEHLLKLKVNNPLLLYNPCVCLL